ncbi:DUF6287 domain-containing protein [Lactococcus lactis]
MTGWSYEGIGWQTPNTEQVAPVYRLYNPNAKGGDHYYTQSVYEGTELEKKGWKWDNKGVPVFFSGGNINMYVAYNPNAQSGSHNYTTSLFEQNNLLNLGWTYGKVAWKVAGAGKSAPEMNLKQILNGDFSSLQGTWKNGKGQTLTFNGAKVTGDIDITGEGFKEATLTTPIEASHNTVFVNSKPQTICDTRYFIFASKNVSPTDYPDDTDKTRDRLFITTNGGNEMFSGEDGAKRAFYRVD